MRNCECCGSSYTTGRDYGGEWYQHGNPLNETKGLCEFCNKNNKTWYVEKGLPRCKIKHEAST